MLPQDLQAPESLHLQVLDSICQFLISNLLKFITQGSGMPGKVIRGKEAINWMLLVKGQKLQKLGFSYYSMVKTKENVLRKPTIIIKAKEKYYIKIKMLLNPNKIVLLLSLTIIIHNKKQKLNLMHYLQSSAVVNKENIASE